MKSRDRSIKTNAKIRDKAKLTSSVKMSKLTCPNLTGAFDKLSAK